MPAIEQSNRTMTQESLVKKRIAKVEEQLKKLREENRRKELTQVMFQNLSGNYLNTMKEEDLNDLSWLIDQNLNVIDNKLHMPCVVLYPPGSDSQPEAWPSVAAARSLFSEYKTLPVSRMMNQENFLEQLITKTTNRLEKLQEENRRKELTKIMFQNLGGNGLHNVKKDDLDELGWLIDQNLKDIDNRIHALIKAYAFEGN
ncbi:hypothetical protein V6N11_074776 [Hibiscus sabdariffa]|uniref:Uncharacterized protein n=1 Tax=Hibiscus sabdariffa TaxID=183260 RepID=A0ABR2R4J4_9ROSI